jgi:hypothetical protein
MSEVHEPTATELLTQASRLVVEGTPYDLIITSGALIEFEKLTGISTITDASQIVEKPSRNTLSAMLYVLLRRAGAKYTLERVQGMVTRRSTKIIYAAILAAWTVSLAEDEAGENPIQAPLLN